MNYYIITSDLDKLYALIPGRKVYPMHNNSHSAIKEKAIYKSDSGMIILYLNKDEYSLLSENGFNPVEIKESGEPLWDGMPTVKIENGKQVEYYKGGGVATKLENTLFGFGREINVAPIYNTGIYRADVEQYHSKGIKGAGVKVGCIGGDLTLKVPKDYGVTIQDTYSFITPDNKIPATGLVYEDHAIQCITIMGGNDEILSIAPDAQLYVASHNVLMASIDWLLSKGCSVIYISFVAYVTNEMAAMVSQKGAILCIAGGNDASNVVINPGCVTKSVNVGYFRCGINGDGTTTYDESITSNTVQNHNGAKLDFVTANQYLTYWFENDVRRASLVYGSSTSVVVVAGILALLKQKYPNYPMRVLVELLKQKNINNTTGVDYPIHVLKN